jgi:hypothetical protein
LFIFISLNELRRQSARRNRNQCALCLIAKASKQASFCGFHRIIRRRVVSRGDHVQTIVAHAQRDGSVLAGNQRLGFGVTNVIASHFRAGNRLPVEEHANGH